MKFNEVIERCVNTVAHKALCKAQAAPDGCREWLSWSAGYSDYFIVTDQHHQEEIVARIE